MKSNIVVYTEIETALLDSLSDGQWHPSYKLWKSISEHIKKNDLNTEVKYTKELMVEELDALAATGMLLAANDSYRFVTKELDMWRLFSITLNHNDPLTTPRYFGNILEDDGWVYAPLRTCHLIHFKVAGKLTRQEVAEFVSVPVEFVTVNEDGLYKIYSENKVDTYDKIQTLKLQKPEALISGIRLEADLKRRNVKELPKRYYAELCAHYGEFAKILLRSQMSSIVKHLPEKDDRDQQIFIWVIEAVKRYDDSTSIPFAAYLGSAIKKWVYDLNRKAYGRSIADTELKYNRAMNDFRLRENREPTAEELAFELNVTVEEVHKAKENINTVVNLRNQKAIDYDDYELPIPAEEVTDKSVDDMIEATILSASIVTAGKELNGKRNMVGLVGLYYKTWGADTEDKRIKSWVRGKNVIESISRLSERASVIIRATRSED